MLKHLLLFTLLALSSAIALAAPPTWDQEQASLSRDYDSKVLGVEPGDARNQAVASLLAKATDFQSRYPDRGLPRAWIGWLTLDTAAAVTDPAAMLPLFQKALTELEAAVNIEPNCCGPDPYTSLAILYQVPFTGKNQSETVRRYFARAFELDPDGLGVNTRYAGYLMRSGDYENALKHANAALAAPPLNNSRPNQDQAVRQQAQDFIEQINDRMKRAKEPSSPK